jgi:hypothetical protein
MSTPFSKKFFRASKLQKRKQGTGNREQGTGNREQGTGNREQGTGNREQGTDKKQKFLSLKLSQKKRLLRVAR